MLARPANRDYLLIEKYKFFRQLKADSFLLNH